MVPETRRQFLHVAAASTLGLAGCSQLTGGGSTATETASESQAPAGSDSTTTPDTVLVRADTDHPPIRRAQDDETETEPFEARALVHDANGVVDTRARADRLTVAEGADGQAVASFVEATDFERATLYLETIRVEACFRLHLCRIAWSSDEMKTDYVQRLRPYDEACGVDETVYESRLIRIPAALDEDAIRGFGSTIGGGGECHRRSGRMGAVAPGTDDGSASDGGA